MKIEFYTGPQCGLCDDAKAILMELANYPMLDIEYRNIRENPDWYHLYAVRIPVLKRPDTAAELGWPFDKQQAEAFIK